VLLAPAAPFEIRKDENIPESVASGRVYYSSSRKYMAVVKDDLVEIYSMPGRQLTRLVDTEEKKVSYFKWLEDRDIALMGLYNATGGKACAVLTQLFPEEGVHEVSITIKRSTPREQDSRYRLFHRDQCDLHESRDGKRYL